MTGPDHGQQIGARLRGARTRRGLSLTHVAAKSGVTKGFLSQVERDLTSPSVGTLLRVCAALELSIAELFAVSQGALVRAGERAAISFGGEGVDEFQLTPAGENRILVLHSDIAPGGGSGRDAYRLPSDAEFVHVIAGTLDVEVAGASYRLAAGDSLTFEARTEHRWCNPSPSWPARVIWVLTPAPR